MSESRTPSKQSKLSGSRLSGSRPSSGVKSSSSVRPPSASKSSSAAVTPKPSARSKTNSVKPDGKTSDSAEKSAASLKKITPPQSAVSIPESAPSQSVVGKTDTVPPQLVVGKTDTGPHQSVVGKTDTAAPQSVVGKTDTAAPQSVVGKTDTAAPQSVVGKTDTAAPQSVVGKTDTAAPQSVVGKTEAASPQSVVGKTDTVPPQSVVGKTDTAAPQSVVGKTDTAAPQSVVGKTDTAAPQSVVGKTDTAAPQSVVGKTDTAAPQSVGKTEAASPQSVVGKTDTAAPQSVGKTDTAALQSIVGKTEAASPQSVVGKTDTAAPQSVGKTDTAAAQSIVGKTEAASPQSGVGKTEAAPQSVVGKTKAAPPQSVVGKTDTAQTNKKSQIPKPPRFDQNSLQYQDNTQIQDKVSQRFGKARVEKQPPKSDEVLGKPPERSLGRVVPQPEDLLAAKRRLRKHDRREAFDPVSLARRELLEGVLDQDLDYLPLPVLLDVIGQQSVSSDLVFLNLSGIEQITDVFFFSLKMSRGNFTHLKKLSCIGCVHLTDQGVIWISELFPLTGVELQGCTQLTEKSIYYLATNCPQLTSISVAGTQVARLPSELANTEVANLNIGGCPLISASAKFSLGSRAQMKEFDNYDYVDLPSKKLVVLTHSRLAVSVGSLLTDRGIRKQPEAFSYYSDWKVNQSTIHVLEFPAHSPMSDAAITPGCIVVITYPASMATSTDLHQQLANQIAATVSKCPDIVIALAAIQDGSNTMSSSDVLIKVVEKLNILCNLMHLQLRYIFASRKWKMDKLDFYDQLSMATGAGQEESLKKMIESKDMLVSLSLTLKDKQEAEVITTVSELVTTVHERFPWMFNQCVSAAITVMDQIPRLPFASLLDIFNRIPDDSKKQYVSYYPLQQIGKIVNLMDQCGTLLYFPHLKTKPTVSDIDAFTKILTSLYVDTPSRKVKIKSLCVEMACWNKTELDQSISKSVGESGTESQISGLGKLLTKQGVLISLTPGAVLDERSTVEECTTETLYLLYDHLPETAPVYLSHLWLEDLPDKTLQADKFYSVLPGLPPSVFPVLINESLKLFKLTLLWKTGFYVQLGIVDILVELVENKEGEFEGIPAVFASARIPVLSKLHEGNLEFSRQCLWSTFALVSTVIESVCKNANLHTYVTIPCQRCNPKQSREMSVRRCECYHFIQPVVKATVGRTPPKCLFEKEKVVDKSRKVPRLAVKEQVGLEVSTVVPYHNYRYLESVQPVLRTGVIQDLVSPYSLTKCFLCMVEDDLTCLHCGLCRRCTRRLAKAERNIKPGFVLQKLVPGCAGPSPQPFTLDHLTNKMIGCIFTTRKNTQLLLQKPMSAVYFNELIITVLRGANVSITLTEKGGRNLQYLAKAGVICDLSGTTHSQKSWKCKEGKTILIRLEDSKIAGNTDVVFLLSEQEMKRITVDSVELHVRIESEGSGLYTIQTPGVKTDWQYQNSLQYKEGMQLLLKPEPERELDDTQDHKDDAPAPAPALLIKEKVLAEISHESEQKSLQGLLHVAYQLPGQEMALCQMSSLSEGVLPLTERTWQQLAIRSRLHDAILVSYSKDDENKIIKICDRLKREGYTVLSNCSEIAMSGVEDRSDFVKAAAVILIGMSRSLENDSICTQEAGLCVQYNKEVIALQLEEAYIPEGCLAKLLDGRRMLDFTQEDYSETHMAKLIKQLKETSVPVKSDINATPAADVAQREKYPGETTPGYVVISFNISDRKMVGMIRNRLKSAGYRVWLDTTEIEQLSAKVQHESQPATVTKAMEKASAILLCLSKTYRQSLANKTEAEFAQQSSRLVVPVVVEPRYRPEDWLSGVVGSLTVVDLSKPVLLDSGMLLVKEHLGDSGKLKKQEAVDYSGPVPENAVPLYLFSELQVSGDYLTYLPECAEEEASKFVMPCLSLPTASVINCRMQQMKNAVIQAVFQNGGLNYYGSPMVLLPQKLRPEDVDWPSQALLHTTLNSHPLCYVRDDMTSVMTMSHQTLMPYRNIFWTAHLVDSLGFPYTINMEHIEFPLMWAWHLVLATNRQYCLSSYQSIFDNVSDITCAKVSASITNFLHKMCVFLFIGLGCEFSEDYFTDYPLLDAAVKAMKSKMEDKLDQCGLTKVPHMFGDDDIYLCETHKNSWNVGKDLTAVPLESFGRYAPFVRSLHLQGNDITSLPKELFTLLTNLLDLDVSENDIVQLPDEIGNCRLMKCLSLQQNRLRALPESLGQCQGMYRLDISGNTFTEMPPCVTKLRRLGRLIAQNMQLMRLPEDIGNLEDLTILQLSGNCISRLPHSFTRLTKLTTLRLNGVAWCPVKANTLLSKEHFEEILQAYHLMAWLEEHDQDKAVIFKFFDEDANGTLDPREIGKLNATIFYTFPRFGYMGAELPDDDTPHGFPEEILSLTNLEYLSLEYQAIVSLPAEIENLKKLTVLSLSHNPNLLSVPAQAGKLPLKRLELEECPLLKTPPKEIQAKGFATTFAYLQRLLSGSVECQRTKLMLVGLGGAGKTSLVKALLSGHNRTDRTVGEDITDGIDICPWSVFTEDGLVTYSVWDFAGQSVYYNTHQFFLSDRAVYMLLWNIRLGFEHAGLDFWLSSISVHAPSAPIFIVGSHVDQVAKVELPIKEMQERYPQIAGFHFVSSHTGKGVKELQDHLTEVTLKQPYMGERIPGVWLRLEQSVASLKDKSVIEYKKLENLANKCGIFDQSEVFQAVQFLHELGSLQHFTNEFLKSYVVVNPQWIVDVMACVVSVKDSHIQDGRLHHDHIAEVWKDYPNNLHSWMLRLTEEFDLTFPLTSEKTNLVPCLLPEKEPEINWPELDKNSALREAKMVYKFDYLPAGLFNRGQVRLHQFSDSSMIWKRGSFLRKNKHICLIHQTRESELVVRAQGPRPENIVFLVHEVFENLIAESFHGVAYDYYLPCPDCMKLVLKDPHMFAASTVRRAKELKAPFLQCLKYFHTISLVTLQAQMPPSSSKDYDLHLVQAVHGLKELHQDLLTDIFIIYCPKDIPSVQNENKLTHPFKIWKDLLSASYKCWFQENPDKYSMDELARSLIDSSVVLVFISDAFVQDEDCCNLFKYACLTLKKPILLVVIGTGMQWKQSKLGILITDEVFVNMLDPSRYANKFQELLDMLKIRINKREVKDKPPCFISYCWKNSASAVALGSKPSEGSLGVGDPRKIKSCLDERGVKCWIDVERTGLHGLFDDIAEGLLNAQVVVACVSDEYSASDSCCREFRYAASTLKLPIILAVVGTGNKWRATEIGVLSLKYPLLSFQEKFDTPSERLYDTVLTSLSSPDTKQSQHTKDLKNKANEHQKNLSFQELYELAQRKFLRQLITYADVQSTPYPYPRLFIVDLVQDTTADGSDTTESKMGEKQESKPASRFCVQILCEHDEGWHCCSEALPLPQEASSSPKEKYAPYLTRIMGLAKYSKKLLIQCMSTEAGLDYLRWLDESPQVAAASDFHLAYHSLRQDVIQADTKRIMGNLARCRLPNGKTMWLCEAHQKAMRITVLSDEIVETKRTATDSKVVDYMTLAMRDLESMELSKKFGHLRPEAQNVVSPTGSLTSVTDTVKTQSQSQSPSIPLGSGEGATESATNGGKPSPSTRTPLSHPSPALRQLSRKSSSKTMNKSRACSIQ